MQPLRTTSAFRQTDKTQKLLLTSVAASGGFLHKARIEFSPGLNCIIGARGTCKSTVVESIRFAFDVGAERVAEILADRSLVNRSAGIVKETLGSGSIRCAFNVIEDDIAVELEVDREIGDAPRILRKGARDIIYGEALGDVEIFSQGDIQRIASENAPELRLQLIDRPKRTRIAELKAFIAQDAVKLGHIGTRLRSLRSEIEACKIQVKGIDQTRADLARTMENRPAVPPSLEELHSQYLKRQRTLELLKEVEASRSSLLSGLRETVFERTRLDQLAELAGNEAQVASDVPMHLIRALQAVIDGVVALEGTAAGLSVTHEIERLSREFSPDDEAYMQKRQLEKTATESLKREDKLRKDLADLETAQRRLEQLQSQQNEMIAQRQELRKHLTALRDEIFELRAAEVDRINSEFGDVVLLGVKRATRSQRYIDKLTELMSGSRLRMQGDIADELTSSLLPSELLEIAETADAQRLASILQRDLGQATRLVSYLRDHPELYDLEGEWTDDTLEITMFDNGVPKSVEELSDGQKATALLPLILRDSPGPLIIDQPEDDLDNSFIYTSLVKSILSLKERRQLIFVTHNANIPVLGDAESVIVMGMESPKLAAQPKIGTLESTKKEILELLEGGKEAFARREQSYGKLLK